MEEFNTEMIDQLKIIKSLPLILNKLEKKQINQRLIELIQKFAEFYQNKSKFKEFTESDNVELSNVKENLKIFLKLCLENVWETQFEKYNSQYQKSEEKHKKEEPYSIESKDNKLDNTNAFKISYRQDQFYERQKNRYKKNFNNWKQNKAPNS